MTYGTGLKCAETLLTVIAWCLFCAALPAAADSGAPSRGGEEAPAVAPRIAWQRIYSHKDWTDNKPCLICAEDGGYYVDGIRSRRIKPGRFDFDLWIWKLNAGGDRLWERALRLPGVPESDDIIWQ